MKHSKLVCGFITVTGISFLAVFYTLWILEFCLIKIKHKLSLGFSFSKVLRHRFRARFSKKFLHICVYGFALSVD